MKTSALFPLVLGLLAVASCKDLVVIDRSVCGNAIVDEDVGEDCDAFVSEPGTACGAPTDVNACRFICTSNDPAGPHCPTGWGCGADSVCRAPSGEFADGAEVDLSDVDHLATGDIDGDGHQDLIATRATSFGVAFVGSDRVVSAPLVENISPLVPTPPARGDFDADGLTDLAMSAGPLGVRLELGRSDKTLTPTLQSTLPSPDENARIIPIDALNSVGDEVLVAVPGTVSGHTSVLTARSQTARVGTFPVLFTLDGAVEDMVTSTAADLFQRTDGLGNLEVGCEELVVAFDGQAHVYVVEPCKPSGDDYAAVVKQTQVDVASGAAVGASGALVADVNGDGALDVVLDVPSDVGAGCVGVDVAYGVGDGTFHDDPLAIPATDGNNRAGCLHADVELPKGAKPPSDTTFFPLALGDLDGDARADVVATSGIYLTSTATPTSSDASFRIAIAADVASWSSAIIQDTNGDGRPDVVVSKADGTGAAYFLNAGDGLFNTTSFATQGTVTHIEAGDFDGDLLGDVVFARADDDGVESLAVLFGRPFGAPEPPATIGSLGVIGQVVAGDDLFRTLFAVEGGALDLVDAATDLAVIFGEETPDGIAVLPGTTDRRLSSPVVLGAEGADGAMVVGVPLHLVGGAFVDEGQGDDIVAVSWSGPDSSDVRLWTIPSLGSGKLGEPLVSEPFPSDLSWTNGHFAAADLDADGHDEVLGALQDSKREVWLVVGTPDGTGVIGPKDAFSTGIIGDMSTIELADMDADGDVDALIYARSPKASATVSDTVLVLWNEAGAFSPTNATSLVSDGLRIFCAASIETDGDGPRELGVATEHGLLITDITPGVVPSLPPPEDDEIVSFRAMGVGDFDGDGLEDVALAYDYEVDVLFQEPR